MYHVIKWCWSQLGLTLMISNLSKPFPCVCGENKWHSSILRKGQVMWVDHACYSGIQLGPCLLTWIDFDLSMDKLSYAQLSVEWNYFASLGMNKYNGCDYLSILWLKLIRGSNMGPSFTLYLYRLQLRKCVYFDVICSCKCLYEGHAWSRCMFIEISIKHI